ncbi:hypothetical protein M9H77_19335 [Catharanthus roseus]|uniref:Uncharacterized protein n=1 Tax=Catharanthus roseus TaxID=4058 RepID=A0ACC0BA08_CATRO|nr:hypothetical protein M9H77_19335 [Catharanthus roseus]
MKQAGVKKELMKWTKAMDDTFSWAYEDVGKEVGGIDEINMLVEQIEVTLESFANTQREISNSEEVLKSALNNVAEALREGNSIIQQHKTRVYIEEEIFKELVAIRIEKEPIIDCYLFLIQNPDKLRGFFGCPSEMRKSILSKMMTDHWIFDLVLVLFLSRWGFLDGPFFEKKIYELRCSPLLFSKELVDRLLPLLCPSLMNSKFYPNFFFELKD